MIVGSVLITIPFLINNFINEGVGVGNSIFFIEIMIALILFYISSNVEYELGSKMLKYNCGSSNEEIKINSITSISQVKFKYSGSRPALALNGLLIKYNKYDELYISPDTNEQFINKILEYNKNIEIIDYKDKK